MQRRQCLKSVFSSAFAAVGLLYCLGFEAVAAVAEPDLVENGLSAPDSVEIQTEDKSHIESITTDTDTVEDAAATAGQEGGKPARQAEQVDEVGRSAVDIDGSEAGVSETVRQPKTESVSKLESSDAAVQEGKIIPENQDDTESAAVPPPQAIPVTNPLEDYFQAIDLVENNHGAYSSELADLYLGLGNLLLREGKYLEAKDAYQQGMQVARINDGLNSVTQEPFLYSLADLDNALGDPAGSNNAINHILQINRDTYGVDDERMLPALNRMLDWYLDRYQQVGARDGYVYLLNSEKLANHVLMIHAESLKMSRADAPDSFRKLCSVEYALAKHVDRHGIPGEKENFSYSFGTDPKPAFQEPSFVDLYYRRGREALRASIKLLYEREDVSKQVLATAVAELADWYVAFDKYQYADEHYQLAYQLLSETENSAELQAAFFAEPQLITFRPDTAFTANQLPAAGDALQITFDISERGVPANLRMGDRTEELGVKEVKKIQKDVMNFRFRPPLKDGVMMETRDYVYTYPVQVKAELHES